MRRCLLLILPLLLMQSLVVHASDLAEARRVVAAAEARRCAMLAEASRAVVCIFAEPSAGGGGSGVLIDPRGYGLTNFHVVAEFVESRQGFGGLNDGRLYPLRVLGIDAGGDIALFKLDGLDEYPYMPLADSDALRVGQSVAALGNPFILAEDFRPTITYGVISGLHRYQEGQGNLLEYADCIQVSTSINPGNSGGPLIDMHGRVIGINGRASFEERGRVNVGLGYAVTANQIRRFLPGLYAAQFMEHGTLEAAVREIQGRIVFSAIRDLSSAERAGIELGDELLAVDDQPVRTPNEFNNLIAILPSNWPVTLRVRRDDDVRDVTARLDRLVLPNKTNFIVDLDDNHASLRDLLAAARTAWRIEPDAAASWCWTLADGERICDEDDGDGAAGEFRALAAPLVAEPALDVDWEFVGGDLLDGEIVAVVARRFEDGRRIEWRFRFDAPMLREARLIAADDSVVTWRGRDVGDFDAGRWPQQWERTSSGDETSTWTIEAFDRIAAPASQPIEEAQP